MIVTTLLDSKPFEIFSGQRDIKVNWPELKRARPLALLLFPNESASTSWLARPKSVHKLLTSRRLAKTGRRESTFHSATAKYGAVSSLHAETIVRLVSAPYGRKNGFAAVI
uniref:Transposase n=1 Tax=Ascaris lumbricoides TaxID=6252 RepID=A0A0M3I343_ASCLU